MRIVEVTDDMLAAKPAEFERLCSLLPVRWGGQGIVLRLAALQDGCPVGLVTASRDPAPDAVQELLDAAGTSRGGVAECSDLVVLHPYRGRGLAADLLAAVVAAPALSGLRLFARFSPDVASAASVFEGSGWTAVGAVRGERVLLAPAI